MGYYYSKHDLRMSLVKDIIKKQFSVGQPVQATGAREQRVLLQQIASAEWAKPLKIEVSESYYDKRNIGKFDLKCDSKTVDDVGLRLEFDKTGALYLFRVHYEDALAPLSRAEDLLLLKTHVLAIVPSEEARYAQLHAESEKNVVKNKKIKTLKEAAIIGKIKELAQVEQVPYHVDTKFRSKIKLSIRLSNAELMEIDILFSNYQAVLQELQHTIRSMKELIAKSVPIKIKSSAQWTQWTMPKKI